jgi:hypothetical protein
MSNTTERDRAERPATKGTALTICKAIGGTGHYCLLVGSRFAQGEAGCRSSAHAGDS